MSINLTNHYFMRAQLSLESSLPRVLHHGCYVKVNLIMPPLILAPALNLTLLHEDKVTKVQLTRGKHPRLSYQDPFQGRVSCTIAVYELSESHGNIPFVLKFEIRDDPHHTILPCYSTPFFVKEQEDRIIDRTTFKRSRDSSPPRFRTSETAIVARVDQEIVSLSP
jgi:hypothetical protein